MTDEMAAHIAKLLEQIAIDIGDNRKALARIEARLERELGVASVAEIPLIGSVT